jgi:hypothetical protein
MWQSHCENLSNGRVQKIAISRNEATVSYAEVLLLWRDDAAFRDFFIDLLAGSEFSAFRWETPPIARSAAERPFEFVLLHSAGLQRPVDETAFAEHFVKARGKDVVVFSNLGGDAVMVVPCPAGPASAYGHLASFVRHAPREQVHRLWQAVGRAMQERLSDEPVWLSTAGMGVAWLHVRLDSRPKYYGHAPYMHPPGEKG